MAVLSASAIVGTVCFATLQLQRLNGRAAGEGGDFSEARIYARAALEIGMLKIRNDPYWRTNLGNGTWLTNQTIGNGKFSLSAADPVDNDVTKGDNHPVVLTGIGMKGTATFKTAVRMEVSPRIGSCLEVPMISGGRTNVNGTILTSDQTVSANNTYNANSATINSNVEAVGNIGGSTYNGTKIPKLNARDIPDPAHVLDYYLASGTTIQYSDLTLWSQTELLTNTTFETDVSGWYVTGGTAVLQQSGGQSKQGAYSMLVKSRSVAAAVAAQDISVTQLSSGNSYDLWIPVYPSATGTAQAALTVTSTGSGVQTFLTPAVTLEKDGSGSWRWRDLRGTVTPTWSGTLTKATVSVLMSVKNNYYMDKVSMTDVTFPTNDYIMDRQLLSPTNNPFGSHQTNANGVYIINCAGKDVVIGRMRIVGTLVFVNAGGNTQILGPVSWEPAVYNFPALLTDKKIAFAFDTTALSEANVGLNLNPADTPYPFIAGTSNVALTETYPAKISGLIYSKDALVLHGSPVLNGVVITDRDLTIDGPQCTITYNNTYLNDPPPGFDVGTIKMKVIPGTWKRVVD